MDTNSLAGARLDALQPAANNTDLWTEYLRGQLRTWLDPLGLAQPEAVDVVARPLADMAAAAVSGWMSLIAGPTVKVLYDANKPQVNQFVAERGIDPQSAEIPADFVARRASLAPDTQVEEWAITPIAATINVREPVLV